MEFTQFALRHRHTGLFMPQSENNKGYSYWSPGKVPAAANDNACDMEGAIPGTVRLFVSAKAADNARVAWARGITTRQYTGPSLEDPGGDDYLKVQDVGRHKDELEVVPMLLAPASRAVVHIKLSVDEQAKVMREAFERTLAEYKEVLVRGDALLKLEELIDKRTITLKRGEDGRVNLHYGDTVFPAKTLEQDIVNAWEFSQL